MEYLPSTALAQGLIEGILTNGEIKIMKLSLKEACFIQIIIVLLPALHKTGIVLAEERNIDYYISQAPFKMPAVVEPEFADHAFVITSYGAVGDGQTLNTEAFAKTIQACVEGGGGKVVVPPGLWLTGPIQLQSNINLHVERGAVILFTPDRTQYPMIKISPNSSRFVPASPIYGYDLKNIAITGEGIIDGSGESWRPVKKMKMTEQQWKKLVASGGVISEDGEIWWPSREAMNGSDYLDNLSKTTPKPTAEDYRPARDYLRPYMVYLVGCENILIEHVTIRNSPKFVLYPNRCKNVTIRYANIYNDWWAQNGDGIDISACKQVIIYRCNVNVGDDGICMKSSGASQPGSPANLANIIIAECTVYHGHGGFVIGSNTDGGMENIFVRNCSFLGTDIGVRVKSNAGGGGLVKDIYINNIDMVDIKDAAISFNSIYENRPAGYKENPNNKPTPQEKIPVFRDFYFDNIYCRGAHTAISLAGLPESPISRLFLNHITISAEAGCVATYADQINFNDVKILPCTALVQGRPSQDTVYSFNNAGNINITRGYMPTDAKVFVRAQGKLSKSIIISETKLPDSRDIIEITQNAPENAVIIK
jgi:polygalacturonase